MRIGRTILLLATLLVVLLPFDAATAQQTCDYVVSTHHHYRCTSNVCATNPFIYWMEQRRWIRCANGFEDEWVSNAQYSCSCTGAGEPCDPLDPECVPPPDIE